MVGRNSLAFRIIALSGIWVVIALVVTALLLENFYRDHVARHYDEHVVMHFEELVQASKIQPDGTVVLSSNPSDPRYHDLHSGWYWEIRKEEVTLARSPSLGSASLDIGTIEPTPILTVSEVPGPTKEMLRVHVKKISLDPELDPLIFLASAPMTAVVDDVQEYSRHIVTSFLLLGLGLLLAVLLQVHVALKPLKSISTGISDVREGKASKLPQSYPDDVQPLVDELNILLEHNAVLLKRSRNQLGDLAHAVKNPLSVINNEAHNMPDGQRALVLQQTGEISKNVNHYLSRARAFGTDKVLGSRSRVKKVVEDLVYAMQHIYQQRDLTYDDSRLEDCWFMGESQDLEEMIGNLMDNACKWAEKQLVIRSSIDENRLSFVIEDDGPGISEENIDRVMQRGHRLDESKPGHGQGLGIVKDIADLYNGSLKLAKSELGGLQAELELPAARLAKTDARSPNISK